MKKTFSYSRLIIVAGILSAASFTLAAQTITNTKAEVLAIINKANSYWQTNNSTNVSSFWDRAVYHTGNMEAYQVTGVEAYKTYSENWAKYNNWIGATQTNKMRWKYTYGEGGDYVLFGDNQICFQTYIDLYNIDIANNITPVPTKIARATEVMSYEIGTPNKDYWWWIDGLYMVMPVMTKMYKLTGNQLYLDKLYEYFNYTDSIMYDKTEQIYYRDGTYVYPTHTTLSGKKDFWSRGNGWAFAAFAKVLKDLPLNNAHRPLFESRFKNMASALIKIQQPEGYWARSLQDTAQAPGRETSGTALFTYGLVWGINNGYLDKATYLPAAAKAWNYLSTIALQANGSVGYIQPIGSAAVPGQIITATNTANFGVGVFLLAASEVSRIPELTSAVNEIKQATRRAKLYPNPAGNLVSIETETNGNNNVSIYDISGKELIRKPALANKGAIDISKLTNGIYMVKVNNDTLKLTKE